MDSLGGIFFFFFFSWRKKEIEAKKKTGVSSPFNPRAFFPKMKNQLYSFCGSHEATNNSDPHHTAIHNVVRLLEVSCALYSSCNEGYDEKVKGVHFLSPLGWANVHICNEGHFQG